MIVTNYGNIGRSSVWKPLDLVVGLFGFVDLLIMIGLALVAVDFFGAAVVCVEESAVVGVGFGVDLF